MSLCIRIERHGGPEVMQLVDVPVGAPGKGELRLRQRAVGLNFIDVYHRTGLYPVALPGGIGHEAAGVVDAVGEGVRDFAIGDRVAYATAAPGSYCEERVLPAALVVKIPQAIGDEAAAALLLKGMTAYYLLHQTFAVKRGHQLLVHAAAGGVGSLLVPWAKKLGARVIGTAGSEEKAWAARASGCDEVILYRERDVAAEVRRLTGGAGVDVAYDSVGKDTFTASLDSLKPRGMLVSFGNASGKPPAIEPGALAARGSLFLTRPVLAHYTATRAELETAAAALFAAIAEGTLKPDIRQRYALRDVATAHRDLEARRTLGSSVLLP